MRISYLILIFSILTITSCSLSVITYQNEKVQGNYFQKYYTIYDIKMVSLNQNNNILYRASSLVIGEYIYFADAIGIHKVNMDFSNTKTLVFNDGYEEFLKLNLSTFSDLQYSNGKIYFLNILNNTIYSMDIYGDNVTPILSSYEVSDIGIIDHFIIIEDLIFIQIFLFNGFNQDLKSFNLITREIKVFDFHYEFPTAFSASTNGKYLYFSHDFRLGSINLKDFSFKNITPSNIEEIDTFLIFRTITNGKIAFVNPSSQGSQIFIINEKNYAEEIFFFRYGTIRTQINSIGCWIYFVKQPSDEIYTHLYRIKNDGTNLELVHPNIAYRNPGIPFPNFNIFSEDLIVFRIAQQFHETYALIRDEYTGELIRRRLN